MTGEETELEYLLEVFVDDFIGAAQAQTPEQLTHLSRALMHTIHDVFSAGTHSPEDESLSVKKLDKGEGQ